MPSGDHGSGDAPSEQLQDARDWERNDATFKDSRHSRRLSVINSCVRCAADIPF